MPLNSNQLVLLSSAVSFYLYFCTNDIFPLAVFYLAVCPLPLLSSLLVSDGFLFNLLQSLSQFPNEIIQGLIAAESKFLTQAVTVAVDAVGGNTQHFSNLFWSYADADIGTKAQVVFRKFWACLFKLQEEIGVNGIEMCLKSLPFIIIFQASFDDTVHLLHVRTGN